MRIESTLWLDSIPVAKADGDTFICYSLPSKYKGSRE